MGNPPANPQANLDRYWAVYKCSLCGALVRTSDEPVEVPADALPALAGKVMLYQRLSSSPYLAEIAPPKFVPHKCQHPTHTCGMAYFAGFERVPEGVS